MDKDCIFLNLVGFLLFCFTIGYITYCAKAQAEPILFNFFKPTLTIYSKFDKKGLSVGGRASVSKKFVKNYSFLQNSFPIDLHPNFSLGGKYDYYKKLTLSGIADIRVFFNGILGVGSNILFNLNQQHTYNSLYLYTEIPIELTKNSLTALYVGIKGKDIDYRHPLEQYAKLSGKHVDFFIGLNYMFDVVYSKYTITIEQQITSKNFYLGLNFGI